MYFLCTQLSSTLIEFNTYSLSFPRLLLNLLCHSLFFVSPSAFLSLFNMYMFQI